MTYSNLEAIHKNRETLKDQVYRFGLVNEANDEYPMALISSFYRLMGIM